MATERIVIQITERGSRTVIVNINRIGRESERAANRSNLLRNALALLGGAAIVRGLVSTADAITNIQNRLRLVTTGTENLNATFDELIALSDRTRTNFEANAELFTRTAIATRELGLTQREVIGFTESLAQATVLSGASAIESANAIRQLSQGLQSGQLRGEEFRSVSEQLPIVLEVLRNDLGLTTGELRELAFEGGLTADIIVGAFQRAGPELSRQFGDTIPTIGQQFQRLRTQFIAFFQDIESNSGVFAGLANIIGFVADNFETFARGVIGGILVPALVLATTAVISFTAALLANPFTAIIAGISVVIGLLVAFSDEIQLGGDRLANLADFAQAAFEVISEAAGFLIDAFLEFTGPAIQAIFGFTDAGSTDLLDFLQFGARLADRFVGVFVGLGQAIAAVFEEGVDFETTFARIGVLLINSIVNALEFISDSVVAFFTAVGLTAQQTFNQFTIAFQGLAAAAQNALSGNFDIAAQLADQAVFQLERAGGRAGSLFVSNFSNEFDERRATDVLARVEGPLADDAASLGERVGAAFTDGFNSTTGVQDLLGDITDRADQIAAQRINRERQERQQRELNRQNIDRTQIPGSTPGGGDVEQFDSAVAGFERGFDRVGTLIRNFSDQAEATIVNAFGAAEDAIVEFVQTGEFNFSRLVDSILADLTRLLVRQALFGLVASFGGAGGFGAAGLSGFLFGGGGGGVPARQAGGPVAPGRPFLVGERGPELFVPPGSGSIAPNNALGGGGTNVTVVNVTSTDEIASFLGTAEGEEIILNTIQRNPERVSQSVGAA